VQRKQPRRSPDSRGLTCFEGSELLVSHLNLGRCGIVAL